MVAMRLGSRGILVTGSHRSGTTWVGQMIADHPRVPYFSEPFNRERLGTPVKYWVHFVTRAEETAFRDYLTPLLRFHHSWRQDFFQRPSLRRVVGATLRQLRALWRRGFGHLPLLKDPI